MKVALVSRNDGLASLAQLLNESSSKLETTSTDSVDDTVQLALEGGLGYIVVDAKSVPPTTRLGIRRTLRDNRTEVGFRAIDPTDQRLVKQTADDLLDLATSLSQA